MYIYSVYIYTYANIFCVYVCLCLRVSLDMCQNIMCPSQHGTPVSACVRVCLCVCERAPSVMCVCMTVSTLDFMVHRMQGKILTCSSWPLALCFLYGIKTAMTTASGFLSC